MIPVFRQAAVSRLEPVAENTFVLSYIDKECGAELEPGQFCMISPEPGLSDIFLPRPFSYYRLTEPDTVEILFRIVGKATRWMAKLNPGDRIHVFGPLGRGFTTRPDTTRAILVGGGIGLPPLVFLARKLAELQKNLEIDLLYGETTGARVIDLLGVLPERVRCRVATENGLVGHKGLVTELFSEIFDGLDNLPAVYTCGPKAMMAALAGMLNPEEIRLFEASLEENMACGIGICQGCAVPLKGDKVRYECCCTQGPVFNGFEIQWQ